jgi:hypothetical protein
LLAVSLALALTGCGKKPAQTSAVQVASPSDKPPPPPKMRPPGPPAPKPPVAAPKPLPGKGKSVTTKSGLKYRDLKVGRGAEAKATQKVTVHYKGWLDNGTVFDSSRPRQEPFSFSLGQGEVIKGWDEGVAGMRVGGVRELTVPPSLGYGDQDMGKIPPNSTLHFEVELLGVGQP